MSEQLITKTTHMPTYQLNVNGSSHTVDVSADTPLLWVLRDHIDLVGTKYGCGISQCGACTVHLDGNAIRSCGITVEQAQGKAITTIEGLSEDASHPLQQAWKEVDVPQCGYCQAGQIMTAAAFFGTESKSYRRRNQNGYARKYLSLCIL